jgi:hypothetical protein
MTTQARSQGGAVRPRDRRELADPRLLTDAAAACCRAAGVAGPVTVAALTPSGTGPGRLVLRTADGPLTFFWRPQFAHSTLFLRAELTAHGWPVPGRLCLADALIVPDDDRSVLLIPPVLAGRELASSLWRALALADRPRRAELARTCALAVRRFQQVRPAGASAAAEAAELTVRHASTRLLGSQSRDRALAAVAAWAPVIDGLPTGMCPRDFYRNLLVGLPLGAPQSSAGAGSALTLIDYGESQKHCCLADTFAALVHMGATVAAAGLVSSELMVVWLLLVADDVFGHDAEAAPVPLFLALWRLRWAQLGPDPAAVEAALRQAERAQPGGSLAGAIAAAVSRAESPAAAADRTAAAS